MTRPKRLVVTGSECTGKTTLTGALAAHYDVPYAGEFVRGYALAKGSPIDASDHWAIARGQRQLQDDAVARAAARDRSVVLFDTDLLSTVAYAHHYTGQCDAGIEQLAREQLADHYLLLDVDVPWVSDGVRDRGEHRDVLHALFLHTLSRFGAQYTLVRGSWTERLNAAMEVADAMLVKP